MQQPEKEKDKDKGKREKKEKDDKPGKEKFKREKKDLASINSNDVIRRCKEDIIKIHEIFHLNAEENNEEFVDTTRAVENILDQIIKNQGVTMGKADLISLEEYLQGFLTNLQKMQSSGRLVKFLTSNRLRKNLEESNMNIMYVMKRIEQTGNSKGGKLLKAMPSQIFFYDEAGRAMWESVFGLENSLVEWNRFVKGLCKYLSLQIALKDEMMLQRVLDTSHVGVVSPYKFSQFLRGFGPLKACVDRTNRLMAEKWFYGCLSRKEALLLLMGQPVGTFMMRFSKSQPGAFAMSFVNEQKSITSVIIDSEMPRGVKLKEQGGSDKRFKDLYELLLNYREYLVAPLETTLPSQPWFHGDLTQEDCELLLQGRPEGTYLIRVGELNDKMAFILTYIDSNAKIVHQAIEKTNEGFVQEGKVYPDLNVWLKNKSAELRYNYDRSGVPTFRVGTLKDNQLCQCTGPVDPDALKPDDYKTIKPLADCGFACTTYPEGQGLWSLICDTFSFRTFSNWKAVALADGCNWLMAPIQGPRPRGAAAKASTAFLEFLVTQSKLFTDTSCVGYLLLKGFAVAHERIIEGFTKEDIWDAGTTTLIGGVLLPIDAPPCPAQPDEKYGFVCASVGDCKAFLYTPSKKRAIDITLGNRAHLDATDPGGRLGPFVGRTGDPDLRNLHLYFTLCSEGDIIILMSDGVHDNLDAYSLGKPPSSAGLSHADWKDVPANISGPAKSAFMCRKLVEARNMFSFFLLILVIEGAPPDAVHIASKLIDYSQQVTEVSRVFMRENPRQKLPIDYVKYPGKMDHASVICLTVGKNNDDSK